LTNEKNETPGIPAEDARPINQPCSGAGKSDSEAVNDALIVHGFSLVRGGLDTLLELSVLLRTD